MVYAVTRLTQLPRKNFKNRGKKLFDLGILHTSNPVELEWQGTESNLGA